ncbi:MAG: type IV pilus secretin PilQ family protein [Gammaproteobacteria bacterium]|jgi:type IV pilus assembly protein PilQ
MMRKARATTEIRKISHTARWLGALTLLALASGVSAQEAPLRLEAVDVAGQGGDRVVIYLRMSGPAAEPMSFAIDDPARISLDLADTTMALPSRRTVVKQGPLDTVTVAEAQGRTRVVLNMDYMVPYQTRVEGDTIVVNLGSGAAAAAGAAQPVFAAGTPPAQVAEDSAIRDIDFRRSEGGGGRVIVSLTDPSAVIDMRQEAGKIVVDFRKTELPTNLRRRLDVLDFATPVTTVDSITAGEGARLIISATGDFEHFAYQTDEVFTVEVRPLVKEKPEDLGIYDTGKTYQGQRLTLNFQDIETRAVLQLLSEVSGLNMVVSDSVTGNVTLRLRDVPWDQALDIVLATRGLDMRQIDNVIIVAPSAEIAAREKQDLEARQDLQELTPLVSDFIQVNYAKASDLAELLQSGGENSLLSERGTVSIDQRTNTLLVYDTAERLVDIRRLVQTLDIAVKQVLIESRIVVVNDDFSRDLGVRLGVTYVDDRNDGLISVTGSGDGSDTIVQSGIDNLNNTGQISPVTVPGIAERYNVNLPIDNPAGRVALAILDSDYLIDLELQAAQSEGRGEIISTPRVITANQKEAVIEQGVEIPYQESASSGATTTQFKKAVLSLKVTPQVTPDDRVVMDLQVNQDTVGEFVPSATGGLVPSIDTRSVVTQVLVNDGETVVLGGIFETERRETILKVPVLGDLPGVGRLFKSSSDQSNKAELLIFVTPKILREGSNIY